VTDRHAPDTARKKEDGAAPAGAAEVVTFWRDLGLPGLVDVHTHFMPQALARLGLGADWLRAVCHDNATRLLGL
jgi:cytosine/adenosine deaminase-related metal-dependent hydrolase